MDQAFQLRFMIIRRGVACVAGVIVFAEVASVVAAGFHGVPSAYTARRANPHHTDFINTERPQATTMNKLRESLGLSAARCH